jgi:hypothetical protein
MMSKGGLMVRCMSISILGIRRWTLQGWVMGLLGVGTRNRWWAQMVIGHHILILLCATHGVFHSHLVEIRGPSKIES